MEQLGFVRFGELRMMAIDSLIESCRLLEKDHGPEGYPAIQMWQVSMLCNAIKQAIPSLDRLQERLEAGAKIVFQDGKWWLFDKDSEAICYGNSIREMLINLIFVDC